MLAETKRDAIPMLKRLYNEEGRGRVRLYLMAIAFGAVEAGTTGGTAWLIKPVINGLADGTTLPALLRLAALYVLVSLINGFATYAADTTMARIGNSIIASVQRKMFGSVLQQGMPYFGERHSTQIVAQNGFVAGSVRTGADLIVNSVTNVLKVFALLVVAIWQDPLLAISALIVMPAAIFGIRYITRRIRNIVKRLFESSVQIASVIQETAQGVRVVKSFGMEEVMRERMADNILIAQKASDKMAELNNRTSPLMETMGGIAVAIVITYGAWRINSGALTIGGLAAFLGAFLMAYQPAKTLAKSNVALNNALVGIDMYYDILDLPAAEGESERNKPAFVNKGGHVAFDHVDFGYKLDQLVLRNLSFEAEAGKTTALVGQSGGGKSTIVNMILRFYDPSAGAVSIDGQPITSVSLPSLRSVMAYVGQDAFLFAGTIRSNIASGKPGATDAEIIAAAEAAYAHDFIVGFDKGYDTQVGERGLQLSGGQRARITIARAILRDAAIVLLDEATAALDSESEKAVQNALDDLCAGRTVVVIAHRLQTIQQADKICVIEGGHLVEEGTHEQLLARRGRYAQLHAVQFREELDEPLPEAV